MKNIYPEHLIKLMDLPLQDFVCRVEAVEIKQVNPGHEPAFILQENPDLATVPARQFKGWLAENSPTSRVEGAESYYQWLRLGVHIFELEEPEKYKTWKEKAYHLQRSLENLDQLRDLLSSITDSFVRATGQGQKELIKKTPSAHFCKRYNVLLRKSKQIILEIEEDFENNLWPPELPNVDSLKDDQPVQSTNYMEIQIYYGQLEQLIWSRLETLRELNRILP